ncbi:unnamed protein product [Blepharisma stoltei]|uniref:Uncharacterized protein n=1 Tax=Blepharisma stoltei TaxID=1481888 RepID=A0AAU9K3Q3_9CILI|nr:unnamed protein product [Blepharisma stoltei]
MSENSLEHKLKEVLSQYTCHQCGTKLTMSEFSPLKTFSGDTCRQESSCSYSNPGNISDTIDRLIKQAPGYPLRVFQQNEDQLHIEMIRPGEMAGDTGNESYRTSIDQSGFIFDEGQAQYYTPRSVYTPNTPSTGVLIPLRNGETVISHGDGIKKFQNKSESRRHQEPKSFAPTSKGTYKAKPRCTTLDHPRNKTKIEQKVVQKPKIIKMTPSSARSLSSQKPKIKEVSTIYISLKDLKKCEPELSISPISCPPEPHPKEKHPSQFEVDLKLKDQQVNLVDEIRKKKISEEQPQNCSSYKEKIAEFTVPAIRNRSPMVIQAKILKSNGQDNVWDSQTLKIDDQNFDIKSSDVPEEQALIIFADK